MPAIRLGGEARPVPERDGRGKTARLRSREVEVGGVATRAVSASGEGVPTVLLHGWLDNADTWLAVLDRLAVAGRPAIAYDLPGFGTAPPLDKGSVLDQLVEFAADGGRRGRRARRGARSSSPATRSAAGSRCGSPSDSDLPLAGDRPDRPRRGCGWRRPSSPSTGSRRSRGSSACRRRCRRRSCARSPAGSTARSPSPTPTASTRRVVDRFTRFHVDRPVIRERLEYAKRLRAELDDPFDAERDQGAR